MDLPTLLHEAEALPADDRIRLVHAIWDRLVDSGMTVELSAEQQAELNRRIAAADANPDDVVDWETIKAQVRERS